MRRITTIALALCLMVSGLSGIGMAGVITPFWLYTAQVTPGLGFNGGYAYARVDVVGISSVSRIEGELRLDREVAAGVWFNEVSWDTSSNRYLLTYMAPAVQVVSNTKYRVTYSGTVYTSSGSEPIYGKIIRTSP